MPLQVTYLFSTLLFVASFKLWANAPKPVEVNCPKYECNNELVDVCQVTGTDSVQVNECPDGRCKGKQKGDKCSRHTECEPGLFCGGTCKVQAHVGVIGCRDEFDCVNNAGCNFGQCATYFSLDDGAALEECFNLENRLCASGICDKGVCLAAIENDAPEFPVSCKSHSDCVSSTYKHRGQLYYTECDCGTTSDGNSYCSVFPGDEIGSDYLGVLQLWTDSKLSAKCNTQRRWELHCMVSNWKRCRVEELLYKRYRYEGFARIVDNSNCVAESITKDYWDLRKLFQEEAETALECEFAHEYGTFLLNPEDRDED